MAPPSRCQYCRKLFKTPRAVNHHISASKSCSRQWMNELIRKDSPSPSPKRQKRESLAEFPGESDGNLDPFVNDIGIGDDFVVSLPPRAASVEVGDGAGGNTYPENERFIESYPGEAGNGLRKSKTQFEVWFENQRNEQKIAWDPFASEHEWALAKWLLQNVGQKSTDEFLNLPIVSEVSVPFPYERCTHCDLSD
jgi:hypothetical protein